MDILTRARNLKAINRNDFQVYTIIHVNQSSRVCVCGCVESGAGEGDEKWQFYVLFILCWVTFYASIVCVWWWLFFFAVTDCLLTPLPRFAIYDDLLTKKHRLTASMFVDCLYWETEDGLTWQGGKRTARLTKTDSPPPPASVTRIGWGGDLGKQPGCRLFGITVDSRGAMFEQERAVCNSRVRRTKLDSSRPFYGQIVKLRNGRRVK